MPLPRRVQESEEQVAVSSAQPSGALRRWPLRTILFAELSVGVFILFVFLGISTGSVFYRLTKDTYHRLETRSLEGNDFPMLYAGAENVVSSHRSRTYESETIVQSIVDVAGYDRSELGGQVRWLRYYNPPVFLLALSPLTLLDLEVAYLVVLGINLAAVVGLAFLLGATLRWRQPATLLLLAALFSFLPVYSAVHHGQPTILTAVLFLGAFLFAERGRRLWSAGLLTLTGIKPQSLVLPAIAALRTDRRVLLPLVAAGVAFLLFPFVVVGAGGLVDYVELVTGRGEADLKDPVYSSALMSWPGFLRAATGSVQPLPALGLGLITLAVFAVVLWRGDARLVWAAAAVATLIAVPHSHPQDWVMVAPAAALLLSRPTRPQLAAVSAMALLAVYLGADLWPTAKEDVLDGEREIYWATLAAFALLLWCAVLPWLEERLAARSPRTQVTVTLAEV